MGFYALEIGISQFMLFIGCDGEFAGKSKLIDISVALYVLVVGVLMPIFKEFIFRGIIYQNIRELSNIFAAIVISSAFFGIMHGASLFQITVSVFSGAWLAIVYEKYRNIKAPILIHIIINMIAVYLRLSNPENTTTAGVCGSLFASFIAILFAVGIGYIIIKDIRNSNKPEADRYEDS